MTAAQPGGAPTRLITPAFIALVAAGLAYFTAGGAVLPVASRFADGPLGADSTGVGIAAGAFAVGALVTRPVVGWASDRLGRRPMLIAGSLLTIVALGVHLVSTNLAMFTIARALNGVAEGFVLVAMLTAASDLAPRNRGGEAFNLASLSLYLGLAFGPPIGETVLAALDFNAVWLTAAGLTAVAAAISVLVPETAPAKVAAMDGPRPRGRLVHPAGIFPGILILCGAFGMAGYFAFLPLYTDEIGTSGAALPLAVYAGVVVILRGGFAKLPDQVGPARLAGAALVLATVGLALMGLVRSEPGLLVGSALFAAGVAFTFPALVSVAVSRVHETERGSVVGTTSLFLDLSFGLAPAFLGVIAGRTGFGGAFLASAAVAGAGAVLLVLRRHTLVRPSLAPASTLPE